MFYTGALSRPSFSHHHTHHLSKIDVKSNCQFRAPLQLNTYIVHEEQRSNSLVTAIPSKETGPSPQAKQLASGCFFKATSNVLKSSILSSSSIGCLACLMDKPIF